MHTHTDVRDKYNWTPLHWACAEGHKDVITYLIEDIKCDVGECVDQSDLVFSYKFFQGDQN